MSTPEDPNRFEPASDSQINNFVEYVPLVVADVNTLKVLDSTGELSLGRFVKGDALILPDGYGFKTVKVETGSGVDCTVTFDGDLGKAEYRYQAGVLTKNGQPVSNSDLLRVNTILLMLKENIRAYLTRQSP